MFSQLSLEARGIATKGIQHGMVHMIEDIDAVIIDSKTDICCIITRSLSDSVFLQLSAFSGERDAAWIACD